MVRRFVSVIKIHLVRVRLRRRFEHFDFVSFRLRIDVPIPPQKRGLIKHSHVAICKPSRFIRRIRIHNLPEAQPGFRQRLRVVHVHDVPRFDPAHQTHLKLPFVFLVYPFYWFVKPTRVRTNLVV